MHIFNITIFGITIAPTYYGLMYLISFVIGYFFMKKRANLNSVQLDDLVFFLFLGVLLGGRLGYVLFYNLSFYIHSPLDIIKIWNGGMSFHGGLVGFIIANVFFCRKYKLKFWEIIDKLAVIAPVGLMFGRIGNYLNNELLGYSPYTGPLAVIVDGKSFFPSTLLESFLEGFVLFFIMFIVCKKQTFVGQLSGIFLIMYGLFRGFVEFFYRQPDAQIGYVFSSISMGTLLSIPMIIAGLFIYIKMFIYAKEPK